MANEYSLANGSQVRNPWIVGTQVQSLCSIIVAFISNEYLTHSFCRKNFRLSNNINSFQIKLNTNYWPTQPIVGNAGNPEPVDGDVDNYVYMEQLLLSTLYLFSTNHPMPKINKYNFAINGRCYDSDRKDTYYTNMDGQLSPTVANVNKDTALGYSWYHENRYVGKAMFIYTW